MFLNSLLTHLFLILILPKLITCCPVLDRWLASRPPPCWSRRYCSLGNVSYSSWPDLFLDSISISAFTCTSLSSGYLTSSSVAHGPIPISGPFIPTKTMASCETRWIRWTRHNILGIEGAIPYGKILKVVQVLSFYFKSYLNFILKSYL